MKSQKTTFHFALSILVGEGKLILDAATAHPELGPPLQDGFSHRSLRPAGHCQTPGHRPETETRQCRRPFTGATRRDPRLPASHPPGQGNRQARLQGPGREADRAIFRGRQPAQRPPVAARARTHHPQFNPVGENADAIAAQAWTDDETTALDNIITAIEGDKTLLENAKGASLGSTGTRNASAEQLYAALQTVQHAANIQWKETDPANAEVRADFRLGKFPPKHSAAAAPAPTPAPATTAK